MTLFVNKGSKFIGEHFYATTSLSPAQRTAECGQCVGHATDATSVSLWILTATQVSSAAQAQPRSRPGT